MIQAFRRDSCKEEAMTFRLYNLNPNADYEVINLDLEGKTKISGEELMEEGLTVEIPSRPAAAIISYKEVK